MVKMECYVIALFRGQQGSGKSTSVQFARQFIDPQKAHKMQCPKSRNEMLRHAENQWLLFYDNVSNIPDWLSDQLCLLSEGIGYQSARKSKGLVEEDDEIKRPIAITSIANVLTRGDALDRALIFDTPSIPEEKRRSLEDMKEEFNKDAPYIYGGLLGLLARVLSKKSEVRTRSLPRMADHARMGISLEGVLGLRCGAYLEAYHANHEAGGSITVEASPILRGLKKLVSKRKPWQGKATDLLEALETIVPKGDRGTNWPKLANQLSSDLRRLMPNSHLAELRIDSKRVHGCTIWTIESV